MSTASDGANEPTIKKRAINERVKSFIIEAEKMTDDKKQNSFLLKTSTVPGWLFHCPYDSGRTQLTPNKPAKTVKVGCAGKTNSG